MNSASGVSQARFSFAASIAGNDRLAGPSSRRRTRRRSSRARAFPQRTRRTSSRSGAPQVDSVRAPRRQYGSVAAPRISTEELKQRLDSGASPVLVDARLKYPYEHSTVRLPGAIRYAADGAAPRLPRDREIVVYDSDPNELASSRVAAELIRQGYRAVALRGGISEWLAANLPTETKDGPRQAAPEPGALKG